MPINSFLYPGAKVTTGYDVANSCRFNDGDSAYMHKTPGSAGNRRTLTFSTWFKRSSNLGANQVLFSTSEGSSTINGDCIRVNDSNKLDIFYYDGSAMDYRYTSNQVLRDVSAWYHVCVAIDTTQGTASNRVKVYLNGNEVTSFATETDPSQNFDTQFNNTQVHSVSRRGTSGSEYFDGYMAETVLIDGQQLLPTSFGKFDEDSPTIWKPIDVSGLTFGTNGFYLDFEDSSNLGNDVNGGTDLTEVNLAATDQASDTCTNNFATLNSLIDKGITYSEGNLQYKNTHGSNSEFTLATIQEVSNGRWYWEIKMASTNNNSAYEYFGNGTAYVKSNGDIHPSGTTTVSNGDIFGFYLNYEDGQMTIHRNGSEVYQSSSGISLSTTTAQIAAFNNTEYQLNFGNPIHSISSGNADANGYGNFEYSPVLSSVNFYSLCTKNLAEFG
tara:strand:+ start:90 stop:1412 length:1323 start_codon:yes stop_codon:yes gene_type:complete